MKRSDTIAEISKSLSALQGKIHGGVRDSKGGHGKYADLAQLLQITRPLLSEHKLSFTQHPSVVDGNISLTSLLTHESGEWIESTLLLKIPPARGANESQAVGSGITYARRYAISSIFAISQEDDDGQYKKSEAPKPEPKPEPKKDEIVVIDVVNVIVAAFVADDWPPAKEMLASLGVDDRGPVWGKLNDNVREWIKQNKEGRE